MYTPTLEQVQALLREQEGNMVPLYREINADMETPVSAFLKIARGPYSFLLESVEGGERQARYSFIGTEPYRVLKTGPGTDAGEVDPLLPVEQELSAYRPVSVSGLPRFLGGAIGYLSYETFRYHEPRVTAPEGDPIGVPESVLMFTGTVVVFDHLRHSIKLVSHVHAGHNLEASYQEAVDRVEAIAGRLSQPLSLQPAEPGSNAPLKALPTSPKRSTWR